MPGGKIWHCGHWSHARHLPTGWCTGVRMTLLGVDYSTGPMPGATARANGLSFVCRYVSAPGNSKNLKASEVSDFSANGIGIVVVFENDPLVGTPMPLRGNAQRTGPAHRQRVDLL